MISTHVLDTGRGEPARGVRIQLFSSDELIADRETDGDGRVRDLADVEPGTLSARLPSALAVLPPDRGGGEHRGRPRPPRAPPALPLPVHDLPRQLSEDELAELFEGRTRLVERLARRTNPLGEAREVIVSLSEEEKLEALDAHPAIGARRRALRPLGRRAGNATPTRTCSPSSPG